MLDSTGNCLVGRAEPPVLDEFCFFHPRNTLLAPIRSTMDRRSIKTIVAAIREAWKVIEVFEYFKSTRFEASYYSDEKELTTRLAEILNHRLSNAATGPFRKERFQAVVRDGKQSTAATDSSEQMPDLTFRMIKSMPGEDCDEAAFYVEAKLLNSSDGCSQYVINGLYRFIAGRYAPRMEIGMMLGYATTTFNKADPHLKNYFQRAASVEAKLCESEIRRADEVHDECYSTEHKRSPPCPANFLALHLWLVRPD